MFVLVFVVFVLVVLVHVVTVSTWKSGLSKTELALGRRRSAASKAKSKFQTYTRPLTCIHIACHLYSHKHRHIFHVLFCYF